jgi:hypothetical protein
MLEPVYEKSTQNLISANVQYTRNQYILEIWEYIPCSALQRRTITGSNNNNALYTQECISKELKRAF